MIEDIFITMLTVEDDDPVYRRAPPSFDSIASAEIQLNLKFGAELKYFVENISYREFEGFPFLLSVGDCSPKHLDIQKKTLESWGMGVPENCVVISNLNGDYVCVNTDGTVSYWEHDTGEFGEKWDGIAEWLYEIYDDSHN